MGETASNDRPGDSGLASSPHVSPAFCCEPFLDHHVEDVLASLADGLVILDVEGRIALMSPGAEDLIGVSAAHAHGRLATQVFAAQGWLARTIREMRETAHGRACQAGELLAPLGRRIAVRLSARPIIDSAGATVGSVVLLEDLARLRSLTETAERGARVDDLAAVAAGLAHEIKNPLGGIRGAAQLLAEAFPSDRDAARFTALIVREVDRVSDLLEQLLELTRPNQLRPAAVNVHRVLQEVVLLARTGAPETLIVRYRFDPSLPDVWADEGKLRQVLLNLVKNAIEAMQGAGTLTVSTRMETDFRVRGPGETRGHRFLSVEIEDTGPGIQPENWDRIFTPFFTTKSSGTGLGLAVSQRLVSQHGGHIHVESEPGRGTRMRVSLPVAEPNTGAL